MKKAIAIATLSVFVLLLIGSNFISFSQSYPKSINLQGNKNILKMLRNDQCTDEQAASCAVFIASIIQACTVAMQTGGTDIIADIKCARARKLINDKKYCLPCLCEKINQKGWKWVQCPSKF